ncbi:hypothetical protein C8R44DRAFT_742648 [Mycena epipterygia]|nr:hypothetical protein C8R44DRAFT_742648 [Mycena epipterygia]
MFPRILSFSLCALALTRATQSTTLKAGTYTIRNTGTADLIMCLHADDLISLSSIPIVPPTAAQWVLYSLEGTGSASVYSMYNRNSSGFAVPDGDNDSMAAILGMAGLVPGRFSINAGVHHTSRGDNRSKFVSLLPSKITNVPWGPNQDNRTWAAPTPGTSQRHLLQLEQANGGALQQWEFIPV